MVRISCCGDSITFGLMASAPECSYPCVMQKLLGEEYIVNNFGKSGATVIADYDFQEGRLNGPYLKSEEYPAAMASDPDIVVLMLGMNDGNPTHCFNEKNGGVLSESYVALYEKTLSDILTGFGDLASKPQLFLCRTSAMRREAGKVFSAEYVHHFTENLKMIRKVQEKLADRFQIPLIDTLTGMDDPSYYQDGVHLTDTGYAKLAEIIAAAIKKEA